LLSVVTALATTGATVIGVLVQRRLAGRDMLSRLQVEDEADQASQQVATQVGVNPKFAALITGQRRLRRERELRGWSQAELARRLGAPGAAIVSRWERGVVLPSPHYRARLSELFSLDAAQLGFLEEEPSGARDQQVASNGHSETAASVDHAMRRLAKEVAEQLAAHEADAKQLRARLQDVESKFPEAFELEKYTDANQLFLAYQIGELTKRLEKVERSQLTRFQVVGIVITTLVAAIAVASGTVALLQAVHVLH